MEIEMDYILFLHNNIVYNAKIYDRVWNVTIVRDLNNNILDDSNVLFFNSFNDIKKHFINLEPIVIHNTPLFNKLCRIKC